MIIKALTFSGYLDVSAPEIIGAVAPFIEFRRSVKSGEIFEIPDFWYRYIPNIKNSVHLGLLEILSSEEEEENQEDLLEIKRDWILSC